MNLAVDPRPKETYFFVKMTCPIFVCRRLDFQKDIDVYTSKHTYIYRCDEWISLFYNYSSIFSNKLISKYRVWYTMHPIKHVYAFCRAVLLLHYPFIFDIIIISLHYAFTLIYKGYLMPSMIALLFPDVSYWLTCQLWITLSKLKSSRHRPDVSYWLTCQLWITLSKLKSSRHRFRY